MENVSADSLAVKANIRRMLDSESGRDRIKRMYSLNDYGLPSPELFYILKGGYFSAAFGGLLGAYRAIVNTRENFLRSNEATPFDSQHLARRRLTDTMTLSGMRAMLTHGFRVGAFTTSYLLLTLTAASYNNKLTIWEHIASGAFIGSVFRIKYGPRGMLAAGCLGGTLGLFAGGTLQISMWLTGTSYQELLYLQHENYAEDFMMRRQQNKKRAENQNTANGPRA